jgi:hypothetical protein
MIQKTVTTLYNYFYKINLQIATRDTSNREMRC